jgi:hypothetical protein
LEPFRSCPALHQGEEGRWPAAQAGRVGQGGGAGRFKDGGQGTVSIRDLGCSLVWQVVVVV